MVIGIAGTTMAAITQGKAMDMAELSSGTTRGAGKKYGTRFDEAAVARGATRFKTVSANGIAATKARETLAAISQSLFDDLVGTGEHCRRYCEAQCFSCFKIDHQIVLGRRLHRHVGRFLALENAVDI